MLNRKRSSGITLIGFLMLLAVVGFFGYMGMRLVPMYLEYMNISKAMEQMRSEPNVASMSPEEIRRSFMFKLSTQYVDDDHFPPQAIRIVQQNNALALRVAYERRSPFIYNLEFIGNFDKSVALSNRNGE